MGTFLTRRKGDIIKEVQHSSGFEWFESHRFGGLGGREFRSRNAELRHVQVG